MLVQPFEIVQAFLEDIELFLILRPRASGLFALGCETSDIVVCEIVDGYGIK